MSVNRLTRERPVNQPLPNNIALLARKLRESFTPIPQHSATIFG